MRERNGLNKRSELRLKFVSSTAPLEGPRVAKQNPGTRRLSPLSQCSSVAKRTLIWTILNEPMNGGTDEELMRRACGGDEQAFTILYARHKARLYGYIKRLCRDTELSEDLFQNVWLRLWKAGKGYIPKPGKFTAYLFTIASNLIIDMYRLYRLDQQQQGAPDDEAEPMADEPGPDILWDREKVGTVALEALGKLPYPQREAFLTYVHWGEEMN